MKNKRKRFTAEEKVRLLRLHLIEKQPISDLCDQHGLNPNVFYRWQKQFFENGAVVMAGSTNIIPGCPVTFGWRIGKSRRSWIIISTIRWKVIAA